MANVKQTDRSARMGEEDSVLYIAFEKALARHYRIEWSIVLFYLFLSGIVLCRRERRLISSRKKQKLLQ